MGSPFRGGESMLHPHPCHGAVLPAIVPPLLIGCARGGGPSGGGDVFRVLSTNVVSWQVWPVNLPIEFRFSKPVDLSSVDFSSVAIVPVPPAFAAGPSAGSAHGIFRLKPGAAGKTVVFQPSCPTDPDLLNGGLTAGNALGPVVYTVFLPAAPPGGSSVVAAEDGSLLEEPFGFQFQTPVPPASPVLDPRSPAVTAKDSLPAGLRLNRLVNPLPPILITIDQPLLSDSIDDGSIPLEFSLPGTGATVPIPVEATAKLKVDGQSLITGLGPNVPNLPRPGLEFVKVPYFF